jgi:transcriptional regulator with XRE-family HTH domain
MINPPLIGLQNRREFRNLTQAALADGICSQSQLNKFEKGAVRLDVHRAKRIAERLGCSIDELL